MGMKDWFTKITDDVDDDMYDDAYGESEEVAQVEESPQQVASTSSSFRPARSKTNYGVQSTNMQMLVVEPTCYDGVEKMADALRQLRPVVINFENTDSHDAARIVDFISGAAYALDGKIEKIGKDIFLCVPKTVSIDHNDKTSFADMPEDMISNWKESGL